LAFQYFNIEHRDLMKVIPETRRAH